MCGASCATYVNATDSSGVTIRFNKPFLPQEGRKVEEVVTSKGSIYLKLRSENLTSIIPAEEQRDLQFVSPPGIEHYYCHELYKGVGSKATVGMVLYINTIPSYEKEVENYITAYGADHQYTRGVIQVLQLLKKNSTKLDEILKNVLLYKSEPFYNSVHSERKYPSCTLYIYDKEMKHAI
jgi:hypothetical protein